MIHRTLALLVAIALSGCGSGENDPGPGGVTVGEARALDEAAEMIEQRRVPPELVRPVGEERPSAAASNIGPSPPAKESQ